MTFFVQICPKWCFPCKTRKVRKLLINLRTKFQLKLTIVIFLARFAQKGCFPSKAKKVKITIEFYIFELVYVPNSSLNWQLWSFWPDLPKKGVSRLKMKKWRHQWILHIRISLGTKLHLKLKTLCFFVQICPKWCFPSKTGKVNTTIEFCIFEIV